VDSGNLSSPSFPNTKADVDANAQLGGGITYMVDDHLAIDLPLSLPFKHDINGDGAIAGVGKIGSTKQVSPTVALQYRLLEPTAPVRPYAGLGLTYAYFYGEKGAGALTALTNPGGGAATRLSIDAAWGMTALLGATWRINERWFVDTSVFKSWLKTTTTLSTGQSIQTHLDPLSFGLSVGYRY
jgi:outer membrane protein